MKHISLFICTLATLMFAACDKIDDDKYVIFAGESGFWGTTQTNIPFVQRAFLEKYTGVRCVNCPKADETIHSAMEKYGDKLVVVAVHSGRFADPLNGEEDLHTKGGTEWFNYFGINSQPAAIINRNKTGDTWDIFTPTSSFDDRIDAIVNATPKISMMIRANKQGDAYNASVFLKFNETVDDDLTLTLLMTEDKIYTTQMQQGVGQVENYEQNHVLRNIVTDTWGTDVTCDKIAGTTSEIRLNLNLPANVKVENCHLVAFVSYKDSRQILNVDQCNLL